MKDNFKILGLIAFFAIGISAISWVLMPANKAIERVVMKNSFQYKEGMSQQAAIFKAQIIELDERMRFEGDPDILNNLSSQKRILNARLIAITINQ